jgi:hypothetical protein
MGTTLPVSPAPTGNVPSEGLALSPIPAGEEGRPGRSSGGLTSTFLAKKNRNIATRINGDKSPITSFVGIFLSSISFSSGILKILKSFLCLFPNSIERFCLGYPL